MPSARPRPFFPRLIRDTGGTTFAIMAAAMIPLAGMVGGGVDASRLYLAKTRLQHACDAGALAGRKVMGAGTWAFNNNAGNAAAINFFDSNFEAGAYGTGGRTRVYSEAGGKVSGVATVVVPMTIMRIFGQGQVTLETKCDAEMRLPNTDVMFVLDTTGSMDDTLSGDTTSKIAGLRTAVKCFFETVARLDTNATCVGTPPSGGVGDQVQVRFGFMPYATNVNVGALLPAAYMADSWPYQTRVAVFDTPVDGQVDSDIYESFSVGGVIRAISRADCDNFGKNSKFTDENNANYVFDPTPSGNAVTTGTGASQRKITYSNNQNAGKDWGYNSAPTTTGTYQSCRRRKIVQKTDQRRYAFTNWIYKTDPMDMSAYKLRSAVKFANDDALRLERLDTRGVDGTNETFIRGTVLANGTYDERELAMRTDTHNIPLIDRTWDGCIEERATVRQASYSPIPSGARDLDMDLVPSSTTGTRWGPTGSETIRFSNGTTAQNGFVYPRGVDGTDADIKAANDKAEYVRTDVTTWENIDRTPYHCSTPARKLQQWPTETAFENYVDGLRTGGNTYHDIGLIWGARFASPTGIFRSENEFTPGGAEIERHMIFMTDGQTCTSADNYSAYGIEWFGRPRTPDADVPTGGCESATDAGGTISQQVNARTLGMCEAIKNKNITLWVIWFGESTPFLETRLTGCATTQRFFVARNGEQLQTTFQSIANQISQLRLTK